MNKPKVGLITGLFMKDKSLLERRISKSFNNVYRINMRHFTVFTKYIASDDFKGFTEYVFSLKDNIDLLVLYFSENERGLRLFINKHFKELKFSILYVNPYYQDMLLKNEKRFLARPLSFNSFCHLFLDLPIDEMISRFHLNKLSLEEEKTFQKLFSIYLLTGGISNRHKKLFSVYNDYYFNNVLLQSDDSYIKCKESMNLEDGRIFDYILDSISFSNKYFSLRKYNERYINCEKNIKRLEFNGYIDIVHRKSENGYNLMQIVPQDCSLIYSCLFHNKSLPISYDRGSQDGILQTFLINELYRKYRDVYYIRNNNDKKTVICTADCAFYDADFNFRLRLPSTFIKSNLKKYVLYDGHIKYKEQQEIIYIPYYSLSFVLNKLTDKEKCK